MHDAQAQRALTKEVQAIERRLKRVLESAKSLHDKLAVHDQSDYAGIKALADELRATEAERDELEERWLELSE